MNPTKDQYGDTVDKLGQLPYTGSGDLDSIIIIAAMLIITGITLWLIMRHFNEHNEHR